MRMFVTFDGVRVKFDVEDDTKVEEVKKRVRDYFGIGPDEGPVGTDQQDKKILKLNFSGADLQDNWFVSDVGIAPSATVRASLKDEVKPIVYINVKFSDEKIPILDKLPLLTMTVADMRALVSRKTGLPVSVFRLLNKNNLQMFDCHPVDYYGIVMGSEITMECWDGWNDLLNHAVQGFTASVMKQLHHDEVVSRYQQKVALFIAAHFGNVDLALSLMKQGLRPDEPTGEHPRRQWCKTHNPHLDSFKTPIHEAAEFGQLGVLRSFVHAHVGYVLAKDGRGLNPLNVALRNKQKACASFLLTKQWSKINYGKKRSKTSLPLNVYVKMKRWGEEAKDKIFLIHGQWKSSIKNPKHHLSPGALVGYGVQLDGFSVSGMQSRPSQQVRAEEQKADEKRKRIYNFTSDLVDKNGGVDPETYFKQSGNVEYSRLPRLPGMARIKAAGSQPAAKIQHVAAADDSASDSSGGQNNASNTTTQLLTAANLAAKNLPPIKEGGPAGHTDAKRKRAGYDVIETHRPLQASLSSQSITSQDINPNNKESPRRPQGDDKMKRSSEIPKKLHEKPNLVRNSDGFSIPLPQSSLDVTNRPFMSSRQDDPGNLTLESYKKQRGMGSRDYAIRCLTVAHSYKKPWLQQVQVAMTIAAKGVKKTITNKPHMFVNQSPRPTTRPGFATV